MNKSSSLGTLKLIMVFKIGFRYFIICIIRYDSVFYVIIFNCYLSLKKKTIFFQMGLWLAAKVPKFFNLKQNR